MREQELRLECLKLTQAGLNGHSTADTVERARAYADFVLGHDKSPGTLEAETGAQEPESAG